MTRPRVQPALGPLDRLHPEPSLPILALSDGDVVALIAQQVELAGHRSMLTPQTLDSARHLAGLLLALLDGGPR